MNIPTLSLPFFFLNNLKNYRWGGVLLYDSAVQGHGSAVRFFKLYLHRSAFHLIAVWLLQKDWASSGELVGFGSG